VCNASFGEGYVEVVDGCESGESGGGLWRSTQMKNDEEQEEKI